MARIYLEAMSLSETGGPDLKTNLKSLKEKARAISLGGITAGHFVKGLKDELHNFG